MSHSTIYSNKNNNHNNNNSDGVENVLALYVEGISLLELFIHGIVLSIAVFNFYVLLCSHILHPNLKIILCCQSASIFCYEFMRFGMLAQIYLLAGILDPAFAWGTLTFLSSFASLCRKWISVVLFVERIIATMYFKSYEHKNSIAFSAAWFTILTFLCIFNLLGNRPLSPTMMHYILYILFVPLSLMEFYIIHFIGIHNQLISGKLLLNGSNLSERFQLNENMHTSRQLRPTFFCHFLCNFVELIQITMVYFSIFTSPNATSLGLGLSVISISLMEAAIEITIITHHPLLKRRIIFLLKRILCGKFFTKVGPISSGSIAGTKEGHEAVAYGNDQKRTRNNGAAMERHFKMLDKMWEHEAEQENKKY